MLRVELKNMHSVAAYSSSSLIVLQRREGHQYSDTVETKRHWNLHSGRLGSADALYGCNGLLLDHAAEPEG